MEYFWLLNLLSSTCLLSYYPGPGTLSLLYESDSLRIIPIEKAGPSFDIFCGIVYEAALGKLG